MDARLPLDEQLRAALPDLTRAERQLATHVLSHYPVAALGSITILAKAASGVHADRGAAGAKAGLQGLSRFSGRAARRGRGDAGLAACQA